LKTKEWPLCSLDELGTVGRGKSRHRPRNDPSLYGGPYPFIQTAEVTAADPYINNYSKTYSETGLAQSKIWEPGVLCIVNAGENTAENAILNIRACFPDSIIAFEADPEKSNVTYIKYYLDLIKADIRKVTKGTTQDNLSVQKLLKFKIPTPSIAQQNEIARVLTGYDNLIENNNRRIAILEDMAQSLYREWFVKFRFPAFEGSKFKESSLGRIPKDWSVKRLDDFVVLQRGFDLPKRKRNEDGGVPIYAASGITGYHDETKTKAPGLVTGRSGTLGVVKIVLEDFWPLNTSLWVKEFKNCTAYYAFYLLSGLELARFNSGASVPTLNRNDVHGHQVVAPPASLISEFEFIAKDFFQQVEVLTKKNRVLSEQRDLLLPKLISGRLRIKGDVNG